MSGIFEKTLDSIGSLFSPLGTDLGLKDMFVRCLSARTKREEEWLIYDCLRIVRGKLSEPSSKPSSITRCLAFVVFSEMLGYKADFAYIYAVNLAQFGSLAEKKMGYLASIFLLRESDPLSVLLVNTVLRDLASKNILIVAMAISASCYLIPSNEAPTILPLLAEKLNHSSEFVRSKTVIALHHFLRLVPEQCCHYISNVRTLLGDKDPGVVALVLQFLLDAVQKTPVMVAELSPVLVQIQRQILEGKLPHEYTYRGLHAPWMQISILRLLQHLVEPNPDIETVVYDTLLASKSGCKEAVGAALVCECVGTLVQYKPNDQMLALAMSHISELLNSKSHNLRYAGLSLLEVILQRYNLTLSAEQQHIVLASLQHPDHVVKRKTLSLLCAAANECNAEAICTQIANYAQDNCCDNGHQRKELVNQAIQLTDKFPNMKDYWHIAMLIRLLPLSEQLESRTIQRRIKLALLSEQDQNITEARYKVLKILKKYSASKTASISILEVYVWALSQFELFRLSETAGGTTTPEAIIQQIIELGYKILRCQRQDGSGLSNEIRELLISIIYSLSFVIERCGVFPQSLVGFIQEIKTAAIGDSYVRDCCLELLCTLPQSLPVYEILKLVNMKENARHNLDFTLSFLDGFVCEDLKTGGQPYLAKVPKVATIISSSSSLGFEHLDLPRGMLALLPSPYQSPVSSERGSCIESFSSEECKSWSLKSPKKELKQVKSVWTKEGLVKNSNTFSPSPKEVETNFSMNSSTNSLATNLFDCPTNQDNSSILSNNSCSSLTEISRDPLEELLDNDFQKLCVNVSENR